MQADSFQHGALRTLHMVSGPLSRAVKKENGRFSSSKGSSGACHFNKLKTPVANEERVKLIPCAALFSAVETLQHLREVSCIHNHFFRVA